MSETGAHRLDLAARRSLAFATALLAVLFDLLRLVGQSPDAVAPLLSLAVVYHWSVQRPDLFTPSSAFLLGVVRDLVGQLPLGLHALTYLTVPAALGRVPRAPLQRSLPLTWATFVPIAASAAILRWGLAALVRWEPMPARAFLVEAVATVVLYPLVAWLLGPVERAIPRTPRAPGI
ncbi:MAG: hypothetical protein NZ555_08355 [Geminicoccaceae bacterium]|nr:hypothetical protein [Geminicoccaceae bacterium]